MQVSVGVSVFSFLTDHWSNKVTVLYFGSEACGMQSVSN